LDQNEIPLVTGADVIDAVYFDGIATNLKPADALFFIFGPDARPATQPRQQYLRLVADIDAQADQKRTETALAPPSVGDPTMALKLYREKAAYLFPGSDIAQNVVAILDPVIANIGIAGAAPALLQAAISRIALERGIAVGRGFTRVTAWLTALLHVMQRISLAGLGRVSELSHPLQLLPAGPATSPLENLVAITSALALAPSRQPPNPLRLPRSVATRFTPQSDIAPRLLAALHPAAAPLLLSGLVRGRHPRRAGGGVRRPRQSELVWRQLDRSRDGYDHAERRRFGDQNHVRRTDDFDGVGHQLRPPRIVPRIAARRDLRADQAGELSGDRATRSAGDQD
jgi:hypothetical protein